MPVETLAAGATSVEEQTSKSTAHNNSCTERITVVKSRTAVRKPSITAWLRAGGTWERPETAILRGLSDRLGDLVNFLGARPFFYSDRVSIADLAVYGMLLTMRRDSIPGSQQLLASRPSLVEFMRRVERETGG